MKTGAGKHLFGAKPLILPTLSAESCLKHTKAACKAIVSGLQAAYLSLFRLWLLYVFTGRLWLFFTAYNYHIQVFYLDAALPCIADLGGGQSLYFLGVSVQVIAW